jgi:hypothetical protein
MRRLAHKASFVESSYRRGLSRFTPIRRIRLGGCFVPASAGHTSLRRLVVGA